MYKVCKSCGKRKSVTKFGYRSEPNTHILKSFCNECLCERTKFWVSMNKEHVREYYKAYQKAHREDLRKKYHSVPKKERQRRWKIYYAKHRVKILAQQRINWLKKKQHESNTN